MLYEVSVIRTSTASRTIRVEADNPESARGKALELAGDTDYTGCVVDYDFDADGAVEVSDGNSLGSGDESALDNYDASNETADEVTLASEEARCPDLSDGTCALCPTVFPGVSDETIDAGWCPDYYIGDEQQSGPVCPNCAAQFIVWKEEGELQLKGKYVTQWDGGIEISSPCTVNTHTREVIIESPGDAGGLDICQSEQVELNGKTYEAMNKEEWDDLGDEEKSQSFWWE